jgi:hypothetical protein
MAVGRYLEKKVGLERSRVKVRSDRTDSMAMEVTVQVSAILGLNGVIQKRFEVKSNEMPVVKSCSTKCARQTCVVRQYEDHRGPLCGRNMRYVDDTINTG